MKNVKKYSVIIVVIALAALTIFKLFGNKEKIDGELKAIQEYSSIVPVEITTPQKLQASRKLEENGVLRSSAEVAVLSETSGKVLSVTGNAGDRVTLGQTLVVVEKEVLESQFRLAQANLANAEKDLERVRTLAGGEAATQQQLEAFQLSYQNAHTNFTIIQKQLTNTVIQSPVEGVIAKRTVETGTYITPSAEVFSIVGHDEMTFVVKVAENDVLQLKKGQKATLQIDAQSGKVFVGMVRSIGVVADLSGRYEVEISIANREMNLRAGMSGKAIFENNLPGAGLLLPRKCIVGSVQDAKVFVLTGDSVSLRVVKAMAVNETETFITEGLAGNEKVILSGQINLQEGSKVKVIHP